MQKFAMGLLGILLMAASIYGYILFMDRMDTQKNTTQTIKPIRTLLSGEVIEASLLRTVVIPAATHLDGAPQEARLVVGKTVIVPIGRDEELAAWKLSDSRIVPESYERYYSFKTDSAANVNNMVRKGDRVDVWVDRTADSPFDYRQGDETSSIKVISGLQIAGVKSAEGIEIVDRSGLENALTSDAQMLSEGRGKPNGKPELNTFIMTDEIYEAYTAACRLGTIRLALPNLTERSDAPASITDQFLQWIQADNSTFGRSGEGFYTHVEERR